MMCHHITLCVLPLMVLTHAMTPVLTIPVFDPCHNYTTLDEPWRATNYTDDFSHCDSRVSWHGWYRLLYHGQTIRMPEECLRRSGCGTAGQLWMNGTHPQLQDGIVTRRICKVVGFDCCFDRAPPIKVKACPGNYYVYQFVAPNGCNYAYCADVNTISTNASPTSATVHTSTVSTNPCGDVHCTEDEVCGEVYGIYGCLCKSHHQPIPESFGLVATCHNSSCWISLSRCLLFEAGFPAHVLHLNDPGCTGTVLDGRVWFHFSNDDQKCGTVLRANKTHFIYENYIQGTADSAEGHIISRQRQLSLQFVCEYPINQNASMDVAIHVLKSAIRLKLPAARGTYQVQITPYKDADFTQQFSGNATGQPEETIYIAVDVEGVDSRQFSSMLDSCWATPINDSTSSINWDLITNQCPNPEDGTVKVLRNGVSTSSRFSFRMFTFDGAPSQVYLHCSLHLCPLEGNSCIPNCDRVHQHKARRSADNQDNITVCCGPLFPDGNTDVLNVLAALPKRHSPKL
ncbi:pancreatic secretory granule membrane major glycoprotein GP2-like isoform X2 [Alosa sapidissima]|uniref:pancreatic secretory granule membrane major glycoprotein GP2-like isoform X2 n=1 Tax=Alosa sapidissima TaxID=34773 RepID=UPI001C08A6F8|nr:pancreatic secretory granule membrane major glycoprotein GP2-like isoform X2 [Alosa sapidissima]